MEHILLKKSNQKKIAIILKDIPKKKFGSQDKSLATLIDHYINNTSKKSIIIFILNSTIYSTNQISNLYEKLFNESGKKIW